MKRSIGILVATAFVTGSIIVGCQTSGEKVNNAQEKVNEAKQEVLEAKIELKSAENDSIAEYLAFETRIKDQEKFLADFKTKIADEKKDVRDGYNKQIASLEKKNAEMKVNLANFKKDGKSNWASFKTEFNHDMNELNDAFKDLTVDNKK